jgi:hypothetical protein
MPAFRHPDCAATAHNFDVLASIRILALPCCRVFCLLLSFGFCLPMSDLLLRTGCTLESARLFPSPSVRGSVRPVAELVLSRSRRRSPRVHVSCATTSQQRPASQSNFDTLPVEVVHHILSYLTNPRSRLPGLSEVQSSRDFCPKARLAVKQAEDLTIQADGDRWATDLFHIVRACNKFNLPFDHFDKYGPQSVWPDMRGIVYRRLWLQHAPRNCIYCYAPLDIYPFPLVRRLLTNCESCFYRQTLVSCSSYHSRAYALTRPVSRRNPTSIPHLTSHCPNFRRNQGQPQLRLVSARRRRSLGAEPLRHSCFSRCPQGAARQAMCYLCDHQIHAAHSSPEGEADAEEFAPCCEPEEEDEAA